ncbi:MAG: cell division protein ZipA C-terminal FtsZ-binding domain-containing protein, partial [Pseudomonadales bacterium]
YMQFGEMEIFHRMEQGESVFSLVNAVEPGTFDINQMGELQTPAVSLFMRAHEQDEPLRIYDEMIAVAQALAEELDGEVKDESRSVVTPQTIEHCREEIRDYQHRHH